MSLKVILCEPYFSGSHQSWAEGLAAHSTHDVRLITHHGGFWKWRMQGACLTLADDIRRLVADEGRPDVLLVSDMVHVPALMGLGGPALAGVPVVLYMHENQLTYPMPDGETADLTYAMTNWLSMAAADRIVFNSEHHRRDVLDALPGLLRRFPDHRHSELLDAVVAPERLAVLPVGVDVARFAGPRPVGTADRAAATGLTVGPADRSAGPAGPAGVDRAAGSGQAPVVLWNHRWEYDKDPGAFFAALEEVDKQGVDFRLAVAGESYQTVPPEFDRARQRFAGQVVWFGTAGDDEYPDLLRRADVVASTAHHEFFGVAVVEAIAAGALPLLPNRLSYPELVPHVDPYLYSTPRDLVDKLHWALTHPDARRAAAEVARAHVQRFAWPEVAPRYDALLTDVRDTHVSRTAEP